MANQNLSQFGEKLFVADADHTFIWDSEASISKRVSRNSWLNSGTLTSDAPVTISQTWNAGTNVMTALRLNVTDTASGSTSKLLELYAGATPVSVLEVDKIGRLRIGSTTTNAHGTRTNPAFRFANNNSGFYTNVANGYINFAASGSSPLCFAPAGIMLATSAYLQWTSGVNDPLDSSTVELALLRDAANTLALRNGAAAQTFNVYGTYTSGTVYERLTLSAPSAANAIIGTNKGSGGGTARGLDLHTDGAARMTITTAGNVGIGTTAPSANLELYGNSGQTVLKITSIAPGTGSNLIFNGAFGQLNNNVGSFFITNESATDPVIFRAGGQVERMRITSAGNVGIGTTSPTSKLHVEDASPTLTIKNSSASGFGALSFVNTVSSSGNGIWQNGSAQTGFGGASSLNIQASNGPLAFHTASVTNALSIAQSGAATFSSTVVASSFYPAGIQGLSHNGLAVTLGVNSWKLQVEGTLLCFSGNNASFPAFKRVGTEFQVVNAGTTAALNVAAPEADLTFIEDRYRRKGAGTPEGVVTAPIGAVYHNTTGGAGTSFYVKESGTGNTGWVGK